MNGTLAAFLIVGDDPFLVEVEIRKQLGQASDLAIDVFDAGDDLAQVLQSLATVPMFSERRIVMLKDVQALGAEEQRKLVSYLEDPAPSAMLLLVASKPVPRVANAVKKVGRVAEVHKGRKGDVFGWLKEQARAKGLKISGDAMAALMEVAGEERTALSQALELLSLSKKGLSIEARDVALQFSQKSQTNLFGFIDAVALRQTGVALESLVRLLQKGEAPQLLFWNLARHFRMLLAVGQSAPAQVAKALAIQPWRAEKLVRQARSYSGQELVESYQLIAEAERKMKKSEEPESLTLERLVVGIGASALRRAPSMR